MPKPKPTAHTSTEAPEIPVIGWVQILVHEVKAGRSEVRIRFPDEALGTSPAAAVKRAEFGRLVSAELESAIRRGLP